MASVIKVDTIKSTTGNTALTISESGVPQLNVPAFSAYVPSNFSLTSGASTEMVYAAEDIDTHGWYDTSTGRFSPQIAGYYQLNASFNTTGTSLTRTILRFYVNDVNQLATSADVTPSGTQGGVSISALLKLDVGDSVYVAVFQFGSSINVLGDTTVNNSRNRFSGFLVRAA